ncbi:hypothetical protein pfor_12c1418 [Rhodobacteraceae bacterium SB2]|nr:hypothetical protein pfor_12c1418 [Rhodobacteraceae bacterium SB2]
MKKILNRLNLILFTFIVCLNVSETSAGTWYDIPNANFELRECNKKFVGVIETGDLTNNIESLIGRRICLDSPGGSLSEVTNFVQLIQEKNGFGTGGDDAMTFATRVQSGDKCESACAVLFMFGTSSYRTSYQDKILEPGAKLGFHSPFIDPRLGDKYSGDVAFAGGIQIANLLTAATYKTSTPAGVLPPELLSIVFGTRPEQMYYIDTCAEMYILGISTPDATNALQSSGDQFEDCENNETVTVANTLDALVKAAHRVCTFSHVITHRKWFVKRSYKLSDLHDFTNKIIKKKTELLDYSVEPTTSGGRIKIALNSWDYSVPNWMTNAANQFCIVELKALFVGNQMILTLADPYVKFGSMGTYSSLNATLENYDFSSFRAFGLSPLGTKFLTASKAKKINQKSDALPSWARKQKIRLSCEINASESKITNVSSYTNLRQQAGLNGRVIERVGLGEKVRIIDPGRYLRYDRCAAACEGSNQNAIKTCIDNNDVWIEVQHNGRRGFLSRKFLE